MYEINQHPTTKMWCVWTVELTSAGLEYVLVKHFKTEKAAQNWAAKH